MKSSSPDQLIITASSEFQPRHTDSCEKWQCLISKNRGLRDQNKKQKKRDRTACKGRPYGNKQKILDYVIKEEPDVQRN